MLERNERNRIKLSKTIQVIILLVTLFAFVSCGGNTAYEENISPTTSPSNSQGETEVIPSQGTQSTTDQIKIDYSTDALLAVTEIENTHPIFITGELPDNYNDFRDEYLTRTSEPLTKTEFLLATQKYLTILSDGHMGGGLFKDGLFIDIDWVSENSSIYLLNENGTPSETEVIEIGGVALKDIMEQVDLYYYAENDAAQQRQYSVYCRQEEMLSLAGCQYSGKSVMLTVQNNNTTSMIECKLVFRTRLSEYYGKNPIYIIKHRMIDDVFYIDLRIFQNDKSIDDTASAIKDAIENGIYKFIIDIRDNGGGDSIVGEKLLDAMGMSVPSYGCYIRFSELSEKQRGESGGEEVVYYEPTTKSAQSNNNISLSILTNNNTFSSATILGVWVQDGKLGNVIGQPSSNSPTSYGDMLSFHLPVSGIDFSISHKKFLRPDSDADPTTLHPDILAESNEDALELALDYLSQR